MLFFFKMTFWRLVVFFVKDSNEVLIFSLAVGSIIFLISYKLKMFALSKMERLAILKFQNQ